ncbi:putative myosin heavy chain [Neospora caninum Liverpool]|uniref:Myosin heavy chain, putative n=1 Tax=Neospora caninum (strain Liverpool) TaxID=572307 RepID=F0V9L7_NEOCL|nr:putative myosin heavy chain [Neospora caninum Liverpool]CBZ50443.1 putative myosin heavy chain [Neospora caninum Liverpool]CEL65052.1 TPA: myosin heavy chain, putative [Neospora caninum Liverpool]|eukprot:XP_003880476.1 putative myosin heavy chain [Neospora caninum Liverpool]
MRDEAERPAVDDMEEAEGDRETDGCSEEAGGNLHEGDDAQSESSALAGNAERATERDDVSDSGSERYRHESETSALPENVDGEDIAHTGSRSSSPESHDNSTVSRRSSDSPAGGSRGRSLELNTAGDADGSSLTGQPEPNSPEARNAPVLREQDERAQTQAADDERARISDGKQNRLGTGADRDEQPEQGMLSSSVPDGQNPSQRGGASEEKANHLFCSKSPTSRFPSDSVPSSAGNRLPSGVPLGEELEVNRRTFLTEKRDGRVEDHVGRPDSRRALFESLKNGPKIREGVERIHGLLDTLDQRVDKLMGDHERDFLLAYRTHMYTIQKQMDYFKQKADEEQTKLLRDVKIRTLEKELNWFMSEALRLDGLCKQYQNDLNKWRDRVEALSEDRTFLEKQVKSCKKQTRALQARLEEFESEHQEVPDGSPVAGELPGREGFAEQGFQIFGRSSHEGAFLPTGSPPGNPTPAASLGPGSSPNAAAPSSFGKECCDRATEFLRNQNARLRTSLEREKRIVMQLRLEQSNRVSEKTDAEDFFLKCCEEVKKEIQIRRTRAVSDASKTRTRETGNKAEDFGRPNGRLPRDLTLQDFLKTDRRRLLELIISNDDVLHTRRMTDGRTLEDRKAGGPPRDGKALWTYRRRKLSK